LQFFDISPLKTVQQGKAFFWHFGRDFICRGWGGSTWRVNWQLDPGSLPTCRGCPFQAKLAKLAKQDVIVLTQIFQISVANLNMKDRKMPKYHL
jgi:hypothetical protein